MPDKTFADWLAYLYFLLPIVIKSEILFLHKYCAASFGGCHSSAMVVLFVFIFSTVFYEMCLLFLPAVLPHCFILLCKCYFCQIVPQQLNKSKLCLCAHIKFYVLSSSSFFSFWLTKLHIAVIFKLILF